MKDLNKLRWKKSTKKGEIYITIWWIELIYPYWQLEFDLQTKRMETTCWIKKMKKFDVFEMKMVTNSKNKDEENMIFLWQR